MPWRRFAFAAIAVIFGHWFFRRWNTPPECRPPKWRILAKCHDLRNLAEYEGQTEIDTRILADLLAVADELELIVRALKA